MSLTESAAFELPVALALALALAEAELSVADADSLVVEAVFDSEDAVAVGAPKVAPPNVAEDRV